MNQGYINKLGEALMYLEKAVNDYKNYLNNIKDTKKRVHYQGYTIRAECNEIIYFCNLLLDNEEK